MSKLYPRNNAGTRVTGIRRHHVGVDPCVPRATVPPRRDGWTQFGDGLSGLDITDEITQYLRKTGMYADRHDQAG